MNSAKIAILVGMLGLMTSKLKAQPTAGLSYEKLVFEKIIYHSSHCNGTCPQIDLEIGSSRTFLLKRDIWKNKGVADNHKSGAFKGKIDPTGYFNLVCILISSDYTNLKFPSVLCCDGAITTIIIYANGKRTILKSMTPPEKARKLISFLYDLGTQSALPPTTEDIKIEE
jgi:hypothetical protein